MKFRLRFSRTVAQDIESALAYTLSHFGQQKFEQYQILIREALAHLEAHPAAPPAKQRRDIHPDAMTFHIGQPRKPARHLFLYRVIDNEQIVQIGRLLHDAMNARENLPDDFRNE
jgi:plasmid stabilization system protein ParE